MNNGKSAGANRGSQLGYLYQQTAVAVPSDYSDLELREWRKFLRNPLQMDLPENGTHAQFRDPVTPLYKVAPSVKPYMQQFNIGI